MNTSQKKIPILEFAVVKFEPVILEPKRNFFPRKWKILQAGSEGVRLLGLRVQILPATPATFAEEQRQTPGL